METIRVRDFVLPDSPDAAGEINRLLPSHPKGARLSWRAVSGIWITAGR